MLAPPCSLAPKVQVHETSSIPSRCLPSCHCVVMHVLPRYTNYVWKQQNKQILSIPSSCCKPIWLQNLSTYIPPAALKQEPDFRRTILTKAIPQLLASQEDPTTEIVDVVELATTNIVRLCKECLCNRFRPFSFFQHLSTSFNPDSTEERPMGRRLGSPILSFRERGQNKIDTHTFARSHYWWLTRNSCGS